MMKHIVGELQQQQVIFVCGPDQCGKSHIVKQISNWYDIPSFKASSEKSNFRSAQDKFLNELLWADSRQFDIVSQLKLSVVFDRGYPCEFSYSKVFGRKTDLFALREIDSRYAMIGAKIIVCWRSNYEGRRDVDAPDLVTSKRMLELEIAYREFCDVFTSCETMYLNVDDEDPVREMRDINAFIQKR
jgi:hypothetical protein